MKKFAAIFLVFVVLVTVTGCGGERRESLTKKQERDGLIYVVNEQSAYTGIFFEQYDNGQFKIELPCKDGKLEGIRKEWYENGQLKSETPYKDGKFAGDYKEWFNNGQLRWEMSFKADKLDGVCKNWLNNGQLHREMLFMADTNSAVYKEWTLSNELSEISFKIDELDGMQKAWQERDLPMGEIFYKELMERGPKFLALKKERELLLFSRVSGFTGKVEQRNKDTWEQLTDKFEFNKECTFKTDTDDKSSVTVRMQHNNLIKLYSKSEMTVYPPILHEKENKVEKELLLLSNGELTGEISTDGRNILEIEVADVVVTGLSGSFKVIYDGEKGKGEVVVKNGLVKVGKKNTSDSSVRVSGFYKVTFDKDGVSVPRQASIIIYDWRITTDDEAY